MTEKKITKRESFVEIVTLLETAGREDLADVIKHEIELLDNKAAKAKEAAAKKKAEKDELAKAVLAVLTTEPATIAEVAARIEGEDVTVAKVSYRLNQLAKNGEAVKSKKTVAGGEGTKARELVAYAIAD